MRVSCEKGLCKMLNERLDARLCCMHYEVFGERLGEWLGECFGKWLGELMVMLAKRLVEKFDEMVVLCYGLSKRLS